MKKRNRRLWKLLKHQRLQTNRALDLIRLAFEHDQHDRESAEDEGPPGDPMPVLSVRDPIPHVEPVILGDELRHFQ